MTKRELYMAVINGEITSEVIDGFKAEIEKIDRTNEERKAKVTPRQEENLVIKGEIKRFFERTGQPHFIEEVVEAMEEVLPGITRQRCSALCVQLIEEGALNVEDVRGLGELCQLFHTISANHTPSIVLKL